MPEQQIWKRWYGACSCGQPVFIDTTLSPLDDDPVCFRLPCPACGETVVISRAEAGNRTCDLMLKVYDGVYGNVLDAGTGSGLVASYVARLPSVSSVVAADIDPEGLTLIGDHDKIRAVVADVQALPFPGRHFDCVISRDLFPFVTDPARALDEMSRVAAQQIILQSWYVEGSRRMRNRWQPGEVADYLSRIGWKVHWHWTEWESCRYVVRAGREEALE